MTGCRYWIGSDTNGHVCGAAVDRFGLCDKHFDIELERTKKRLAREKARREAAEARWRRSHLSDTNVARVAELDRIMKRLRADIERMERS